MTFVSTEDRDRFITEFSQEIERRLSPELARSLTDFGRHYFQSFPLDELAEVQLSDIYGALFTWWNFIAEHDRVEPKIAVFDPTLEEEGWLSGRTIINILQRDMPFLVDSIRLELNRRQITIYTLHSVVLSVVRDDAGRLETVLSSEVEPDAGNASGGLREAAIHIEIGKHSSAEEHAEIRAALADVLADVALVVDDFRPMRARAQELLDELEEDSPRHLPSEDVTEACDFLHWMIDNHFAFLGLAEYEILEERGGKAVRELAECRRGLLKKRDPGGGLELLDEMNPGMAKLLLEPQPLDFSKSGVRSRVHRSAYPDYVTVKRFDAHGELVGEVRILGLYTSRMYTISPFMIPVLRKKVGYVMRESGLRPEGHGGKDLQHVLEVLPRDELFQSTRAELLATAMGIVRIQERRHVRLFVRRGRFGRFVSCLVFIPRDLYNTDVRNRVQAILSEAFDAKESDFTIRLAESVLTQIHFVMRVDSKQPIDVDLPALEQKIVDQTRTWKNQFLEALLDGFGEEKGAAIARKYEDAFPPSYQDHFDPRSAVADIRTIRQLNSGLDIAMSFFRPVGTPENSVRFRLFHLEETLALSDVMPILENMGLRVMGEHPYLIRRRDGEKIWINDFELVYGLADTIDVHEVRDNFQEAFANIWYGKSESDAFNRLILGTRFSWREVALLRSYARYMKQISFHFSQSYIARTLSRNLVIAQKIVALFQARFDPEINRDPQQAERLEARLGEEIVSELEKVASLDEDRIIRRYIDLIRATLRTNYFQAEPGGEPKDYFSFKLLPEAVPEMPLPRPLYEIFVYSPRVEGVHLRGGKVARGGLRWSDRKEDYRKEVLGLVKAQQVKNAVIAPVGAKGGFVAKRLPDGGSRDDVLREGVACYRIFVQGLLDVTDNLVEGEVVPAPQVVRKDDDDTYLVVAADKGTASFSDIANEISAEHGFWLGDAFASGGSVGYDHKKMGITARGAWVSVQRHFRERGLDVQNESFRVLGIGDMAGDVFGNGMLQSEHILLVAAFDHRSIFIDPDPDPAASFRERKRLFELPRSSWRDYDAASISAGGGVFSRGAKSIAVTPEMRAVFEIEAEHLTPSDLIAALLKAPVDLLWNGGIGTYVKAASESHAEVGDKANDALRVDGRELRCKVVGEGGNLGFTQLGRVEFALNGGAINTDFVDNAGGVDCSDHEVNVKILLNEVLSEGDMTEKQRREILREMTESVAELVLTNNFLQVQAISIAEREAGTRMGEYRRLINALENDGKLDRALESIPDDEALAERVAQGKRLVRPELSVLISYAKMILKEELASSEVTQDPCLCRALEGAFPSLLREKYREKIEAHRLRDEIVATQIANDLVNHMGFTFVQRLKESTGVSTAEVARAYVTAREVFRVDRRWRQIERLNHGLAVDTQMKLMAELMRLVRRGTRWFLRNRRRHLDPQQEIERFAGPVQEVSTALHELLRGDLCQDWRSSFEEFLADEVPRDVAHYVAGAPSLNSCLGIVESAQKSGASVQRVAEVFFAIGEKLELHWFRKQVRGVKVENHWQALARESALDDLDWQQRALTIALLESMPDGESIDQGIARWMTRYEAFVSRWQNMLTELHSGGTDDFVMYTVALRELLDLAQSSALHACDGGSGRVEE